MIVPLPRKWLKVTRIAASKLHSSGVIRKIVSHRDLLFVCNFNFPETKMWAAYQVNTVQEERLARQLWQVGWHTTYSSVRPGDNASRLLLSNIHAVRLINMAHQFIWDPQNR